MADFNITKYFRNQYLTEAEISAQSIKTNNFEHDRLWKVLIQKYEKVQRLVSTKYTEDEYDNLVKEFIDYMVKFDVSYNFSLMDPVEIIDIFVEWIEDNNLDNPDPNDPDDAEHFEDDELTEDEIQSAEDLENAYELKIKDDEE